ncbi:MAG: type II toxin-antitoxin system VapC family toxin [Vicinamibacteria bacterium]|nr:type II toxin-antitoxin system VapC family toxin [Vicinamibacteria bacterium]
MILPDVNVLLFAFRNDSANHCAYRDWLTEVINGDSAYGMSPQVLAAVIRISTHPRIYAKPSRVEEAFRFAQVLLEQPHCTAITPGERHWSIFHDLCLRSVATGNLTQDAWLAALAIESGCEWITTDRDFSRFPGLRWRAPFT